MSTSEGPPARNTRAAHKARHRQGSMTPSALSSVSTRARSQSATPAPGRRRSSAPAQKFSTALPGESNVPSAAGTAGERAEERISPDHVLIETSILSFEPELVYTTAPIDTYPSEEGTSIQPLWDKGKRRARDVISNPTKKFLAMVWSGTRPNQTKPDQKTRKLTTRKVRSKFSQ
ncbi:hypothetical protein BC826DRAFT_971469 [Russula brevipes]|nr:hypothetical protein BC826DRAFT_971469 [Russula brevipes]